MRHNRERDKRQDLPVPKPVQSSAGGDGQGAGVERSPVCVVPAQEGLGRGLKSVCQPSGEPGQSGAVEVQSQNRVQAPGQAAGQGWCQDEAELVAAAPPKVEECCGFCKFRLEDGCCHRDPPQQLWPYTNPAKAWIPVPASQWCGEFKFKEKEAA